MYTLSKSFASMSFTIDSLLSLGCPGSREELAIICSWLRKQAFFEISDLRGAGDLAALNGQIFVVSLVHFIKNCLLYLQVPTA